jgi:hypothetical protein
VQGQQAVGPLAGLLVVLLVAVQQAAQRLVVLRQPRRTWA